MELRTERLVLRPWDPDSHTDVAIAHDIYRRMEVVRWLGAAPRPSASLDDARARLTRWGRAAEENPGFGLWAVVPEDVGTPVGTVLLLPLTDAEGNRQDDVEIGWHFHPDHWGRGYASESARALLSYAFDTLALEEVNAVAYAGNEPSFAVMRRLGMVHQGSTDRWFGVTLEWYLARPEARRDRG